MTDPQTGNGGRPTRGDVREAVLTAAQACFAEHGYRAVTLDQIGERAGFSKGAIYSNFENKADLFLQLHASAALEQADAMLEAIQGEGHTAQDITDAAAHGIVAMIRLPVAGPLIAEVESEAVHDPRLRSRLAGVRLELTIAIAERLDVLHARVGARSVVPTVELVRIVNSLVTGLALEAVGAEEGVPVIEATTVAAFMARLVRPIEPAG